MTKQDIISLLAQELAPIVAPLVAEQIRTGGEKKRTRPYTVREAAMEIGQSQASIYRMVYAGRLPRVPNTGKLLIPASAIERMISEPQD